MKFRFDSDMTGARIDLWKFNYVKFSSYSALNSLLSLGFYPSDSPCNNNELKTKLWGDLTSAFQHLMEPYRSDGDRFWQDLL